MQPSEIYTIYETVRIRTIYVRFWYN